MIKKVSKSIQKAIEEDVAEDLRNPSIGGHTRSLTMKVDPSRYFRYNKARYDLHKSGQEILTEALDLWLIKHKM